MQKRFHPEIVQRGSEENGAELPGVYVVQIKIVSCAVDQLDFLFQNAAKPFSDQLVQMLRVGKITRFRLNSFLPAVKFTESKDRMLLAIVNSLEIPSASDRPVHGIGADSEFLLQFFDQIKRTSRFAVQFIDESEDRNMPHCTDPKEFPRLRFNSFCGIYDHHSRICRHEGTIGILRKILMPGRVQDIDAVSFVFKLHHGRSNGDPALLFQLHPVGNRMPGGRFSFYSTCKLNRSAVQKQFFRQGGFACIRM